MEDAEYFAEKARQCRRLLHANTDPRTVEALTVLSAEFEATAKAIEVFARTAPSVGHGGGGRFAPDDKDDPR